MGEYFEIGQIVNTSGLKGIVKVNCFSDDIRRFDKLSKVLIEKNKNLTEYMIEEVRYSKNQVLIKFKGIDTIEEAETFKNCYIKIKREELEELPEDTYYIVDLIGINVYLENEILVGEIIDVFPTGSNDVYVIKREENTDLLIPAIKDVVKSINIKEKKMIINLIEGLEWWNSIY